MRIVGIILAAGIFVVFAVVWLFERIERTITS